MTDIIENEDIFTPGQILREMRIERGFDIAHVSSALHIMPGFIKAIEDNEFDKITTGRTFAKGYLRAYAKFLGADPEPLIDAFEKMHAPVKKRSIKILPSKKTKSIVVGESKRSKLLKKVIFFAVVLAIILAAFIVVKEQGWLNFNESPASDTSNAAPLTISPVQPLPNFIDDKDVKYQELENDYSQDALEDGANETIEKTSVVVKDQLRFELTDDSWIEVRDSHGERIYADLARRDNTFEIEGDAPFAIIIGDGSAVSLTLNGRNVPFSYGRNNYAEFTAQ